MKTEQMLKELCSFSDQNRTYNEKIGYEIIENKYEHSAQKQCYTVVILRIFLKSNNHHLSGLPSYGSFEWDEKSSTGKSYLLRREKCLKHLYFSSIVWLASNGIASLKTYNSKNDEFIRRIREAQ